jgi:hypothetical protein
MVQWKSRLSGFVAFKIAVVMVGLGTISAAVLLAYQQYQFKPAYAATNPNTSTTAWPVQSNATYGLSYSYPSNWAPSGDVPNNPKTSATRQEFGTGLKLNTNTTNNNTVEIEVLDEPLKTAEAWYDQYYAQTPIKVNKTTATLKGKQSIEYDFVAPTYETKQYLFAVGTKTYLFSSVNESLNVSTSADYWSNFDNIFNSLTIQK